MHLRKSRGQSKIFVCVGVDSVCSVSCSILCNVSLGGIIVGESLAEDGVLTGLDGCLEGHDGGKEGDRWCCLYGHAYTFPRLVV